MITMGAPSAVGPSGGSLFTDASMDRKVVAGGSTAFRIRKVQPVDHITVKKNLVRLGYPIAVNDDPIAPTYKAALYLFQGRNGLEQTSIANPDTRAAIAAAAAALDAKPAQRETVAMPAPKEQSNTMLLPLVVGGVAVAAVGAFLLTRKKKK